MTSPEQLWSLFAHQVASRPKVRLSRDGGRSYTRPQNLPRARPTLPAAVATYDADGATTCLCLDFDVKGRGGVQLAIADSRACAQMIRAAGGDVVVDRSPSGGRHVYVPLQRARTLEQVRPLMVGLAARFTTLDPSPMRGIAGAIRPPGAEHPRGGHQTLETPLSDAERIFRARNGDDVWSSLCQAVGPVDYVPHAAGGLSTKLLEAPQAHRPGGRVPLPPTYAAIAQTGVYDAQRYRSPSEARQAVLTSAYIRGWTLAEVATAMDAGDWAGLRRFYGRYGRHRARALFRDWCKAARWADARSVADRSDTRGSTHTPPGATPVGEHRHLRRWWTAMSAAERSRYTARPDQSTRLVLRALAAAAQRAGSRYVKVGCRSLALGSTLSHQTVAVALRRLREEADPLLVLIDGQRGHGNADIYELAIPDDHAEIAERGRWRSGRLESIHPAFSVLGAPAALVYDALREAGEPIETVQQVAAAALLGRDSTGEALRELAAYGLAVLEPTGWVMGPASLSAVADVLGALEWHQERVERFRDQRDRYRKRLARMANERAEREHAATAAAAPDHDDLLVIDLREPAVEDQGETAFELLYRKLGAVLVPT